jgi:glutamine amidotransferase
VIAVIDYGVGNVRALLNIYKRLNIPAQLAAVPSAVEAASKVILPGVGAFDWAMTRLNLSGLRNVLDDAVLRRKIPVLGICVGMQMLARSSAEGQCAGLGWIDAKVHKFDLVEARSQAALPHMGWNDVKPRTGEPLFNKLERGARFYFLHSYYLACQDQHVAAETDYFGPFTSSVHVENIFGVQFHPEKSHRFGIQLLQNFAEV